MKPIDKDGIKVSLLILCSIMFAISCVAFGSAWTQSDYSEQPAPYGEYIITESSWYDPLGIWTDVPVEKAVLVDNTIYIDFAICDSCNECRAKKIGDCQE